MSFQTKDRQENVRNLVEYDDIDTYYLKNRFQTFDIYNEFNQLADPVEGFKKIFDRLSSSTMPYFINLKCGAQYLAIAQKYSYNYGCAIIFGYSVYKPKYIRLYSGTWYDATDL